MSKDVLYLTDVLTEIAEKKVMKNFLIDITTPTELKTLQERLNVAMLLEEGISYKEIAQKTGSSTTTITRVARFLKNEKFGGYRWVVKHILKKKPDIKNKKKDKNKIKKNKIEKSKIKKMELKKNEVEIEKSKVLASKNAVVSENKTKRKKKKVRTKTKKLKQSK